MAKINILKEKRDEAAAKWIHIRDNRADYSDAEYEKAFDKYTKTLAAYQDNAYSGSPGLGFDNIAAYIQRSKKCQN